MNDIKINYTYVEFSLQLKKCIRMVLNRYINIKRLNLYKLTSIKIGISV